MALKYSKQREVIKEFLQTRKDHPTADTVYVNVRKSFPNISLGTVYRNLQLLVEIGEIQKVNVGDGIDHFDADIKEHFHFICKSCGSVIDLNLSLPNLLSKDVLQSFDGSIEGHTTYFYGICHDCLKKSTN